MEGEKRELQLLFNGAISTDDPTSAYKPLLVTRDQTDQPQLDLSLSMSIIPPQLTASNKKSMQVPEQHAEQIRLATLERAYAERTRAPTRTELEQAEKEFARARMIWEHARDEVEKVESMKMIATRRISSTCIEITCQSCRQQFRPSISPMFLHCTVGLAPADLTQSNIWSGDTNKNKVIKNLLS